jgi:hypothetical protein
MPQLRADSEAEARRLWGKQTPMTDNERAAAEILADAFAAADERLRDDAMLMLAEYEAGDFEWWCATRKQDKTDASVKDHYTALHTFYIVLWNRLGSDEFFRRLEPARLLLKSRLKEKGVRIP